MCYDRSSVGKKPMCATVCPSQALFFGTREQIEQMRPLSMPMNTFQFGRQTITTQVHVMVPRKLTHAVSHIDVTAAMLLTELLAAEGKRTDAEQTLEQIIKELQALRQESPGDLTPVFFLSACYRQMASIARDPEQRRLAYLTSAEAWHSWPSTSFTIREEHKDRAAAAP